MDSTPSMPGPPKDQKAAEEALTKLLQEATAITSDRRTDMTRLDALRAAEQSVDAMLGPVADLKGDRFSGTPSPGRRASRVLTRLLIVTIIGVGSILASLAILRRGRQEKAREMGPAGRLGAIGARAQAVARCWVRRRTTEHSCRSGIRAGFITSCIRCPGHS